MECKKPIRGRFVYVVAYPLDDPPPTDPSLSPVEHDLATRRGEFKNFTAYASANSTEPYAPDIEQPVLKLCEVRVKGKYEENAIQPLVCKDQCSPNLVGF